MNLKKYSPQILTVLGIVGMRGNRGCIYLCLNNNSSRKKHKGFSFEFVK